MKNSKNQYPYIVLLHFMQMFVGISFSLQHCRPIRLSLLVQAIDPRLMLLMDQRKSQLAVFELQKLQSDCVYCFQYPAKTAGL